VHVFPILHNSRPPDAWLVFRNSKFAALAIAMRFYVFVVINTFCSAKIAKAIIKAIAVDVVNLKAFWVRTAAKHPDDPVNQISFTFKTCRKIAAVVYRSSPFTLDGTASRNAPNKVAPVCVPREKFA
jgi:hypothetical protein